MFFMGLQSGGLFGLLTRTLFGIVRQEAVIICKPPFDSAQGRVCGGAGGLRQVHGRQSRGAPGPQMRVTWSILVSDFNDS
jgi:hypothetical protein